MLISLFGGTANAEGQVRQLRELEHRGDEITQTALNALSRSLIPTISRDDIQTLVKRLDDVVDHIEEAGRRLYLYRLDKPTLDAQRLAAIVAAQATILAAACSHQSRGGATAGPQRDPQARERCR